MTVFLRWAKVALWAAVLCWAAASEQWSVLVAALGVLVGVVLCLAVTEQGYGR